MKKLTNIISIILLIIIVGFNMWLNYPELNILADPNDNIFQYSLVHRTNWVWQNYGCPLSLSCLPNLIDHVVPTWAEGYPLPYYYSHIPQILIVSSYHLLIHPLSTLFTSDYTLYQYYNLTKYLLLTLFPIPVFLALRLAGFSPIVAALGAFFSSNFSTDGLYGIDPPSYLWRGYGLTSQLYSIFFMPMAIAYTYKALKNINGGKDKKDSVAKDAVNNRNTVQEQSQNQKTLPSLLTLRGLADRLSISNYTLWAIIFQILAVAGHLGIGIISLMSTIPFMFFDFDIKHIWVRAKKLFWVYVVIFIALSYWIIPVLIGDKYHMISFWDPIWKFNSFGWYEVVNQFLTGQIFDWQRAFPIITAIVAVGFFALLANLEYLPFALLFAFFMILYFGKTTWGFLDIMPGMSDFHQERFIVGVHIAALFLIPAGLYLILILMKKIIDKAGDKTVYAIGIFKSLQNLKPQRPSSGQFILKPKVKNTFKTDLYPKFIVYQNVIFYILAMLFILCISYYTSLETLKYAKLNNRWIGEANSAYLYDVNNFNNLSDYLKNQPSGRVYAGRPGNWGHDFKLGSTQMYMLFGVHGLDMSQFLPETWSPLSENEQDFDERVAADYDLLDIRYIVAPKNEGFTDQAKMVKQFGPFELYEVPTTGWFDVVSSPMLVKTSKTNFINIVHMWHRSYPKTWNMYPLISVENNPVIPPDTKRIITMTDEVSYKENNNGKNYNIFADFPFVFPEATVSGKIVQENINKQTYAATIDVPQNCQSCFIMFKMSYHPDWTVKVDGMPAQKFAVFPFYLATPATPGTHIVEFTYEPNRLKIMLLLSEITIFILFLFRKKIGKYLSPFFK